jgi:fermentation-respiration switch protein FrsA (DUF1100 family)
MTNDPFLPPHPNSRSRVCMALILILMLSPGCMTMDNFLFNAETLDHYALPGNTIPDSLLERVTLTSGGNRIYGYWVASDGRRPGITILYSHGNRHNIDEYWDRVMMLHDLGVNVFIYDYRGFGMSEGESSEEGIHADAEAALAYVRSHAVPDDSLCLYGFSLGNVPTIYLASSKVTPRCVISESPFASANSLTQSGAGLDLPPRWLTDGTFDNASLIRNIHSPYLLLHGLDDDFVRFRDNGRVVFDNAPEPKKLVTVPGAKHTDVPQTMGVKAYLDTLAAWIDRKG